MYRTAAVLGAVALLLTSVDLSAQSNPDLSGSWTMVAPAGAPPAGGAGGPGGGGGRGGGMGGGMMGLGQAATITQTPTQLTIVRSLGGTEIRSVYNLDGSESRNTMSFGGNEIEQVSRAAWDAGKLVIRTPSPMGNGETVMSLSLNAEGQLALETTGPGRGGGAPTTTTLTYTK